MTTTGFFGVLAWISAKTSVRSVRHTQIDDDDVRLPRADFFNPSSAHQSAVTTSTSGVEKMEQNE